jgi:hypothetical protein
MGNCSSLKWGAATPPGATERVQNVMYHSPSRAQPSRSIKHMFVSPNLKGNRRYDADFDGGDGFSHTPAQGYRAPRVAAQARSQRLQDDRDYSVRTMLAALQAQSSADAVDVGKSQSDIAVSSPDKLLEVLRDQQQLNEALQRRLRGFQTPNNRQAQLHRLHAAATQRQEYVVVQPSRTGEFPVPENPDMAETLETLRKVLSQSSSSGVRVAQSFDEPRKNGRSTLDLGESTRSITELEMDDLPVHLKRPPAPMTRHVISSLLYKMPQRVPRAPSHARQQIRTSDEVPLPPHLRGQSKSRSLIRASMPPPVHAEEESSVIADLATLQAKLMTQPSFFRAQVEDGL